MSTRQLPSGTRDPANGLVSSCILMLAWGAVAALMLTAVFRHASPASPEGVRPVAMRAPDLDPDHVVAGESIFLSTCATCHGANALGVRGQGKNLVYSPFALSSSDRELLQFIKTGRSKYDRTNTTNVTMPPRGGVDSLSDEQLREVVAYLRSLQDPWRVDAAQVEQVREAARAAEEKAAAERAARKALKQAAAAAGATPAAEEEDDPETIAFGHDNFISTCSSCHGKDALGLKNNGKDLVHSTFAKGLSDDDLMAFVKHGRDPGDPLNTTKIAMPPKGGNPALNDEKLEAIIAFLRSLQKAAPTQQ